MALSTVATVALDVTSIHSADKNLLYCINLIQNIVLIAKGIRK